MFFEKMTTRGVTKVEASLVAVIIVLGIVGAFGFSRPAEVTQRPPVTATQTVTATAPPRTVTVTAAPPPAPAPPFVQLRIATWNVAARAVSTAVEEFKKTHFNFRIEVVPLGRFEILDKITADFTAHTGSFDIVTYVHSWSGTLAPFLADLGTLLRDVNPSFDKDEFIPVLWENFAVFKGKTLGLPFIIDTRLFFYRTDLFNDPTNQREFKAQFGYDLVVPRTRQQLLDVAKFFTKAHGSEFGFLTHLDTPSVHIAFLETFATWRRSPEGITKLGAVPGGWGEAFTNDLKPAFSSDLGVQTVKWLAEITKFMPQPPTTLTFDEALKLFRDGKSATLTHWTVGISSIGNKNISKVWDKFGVAEVSGLTPLIGGWGAGVNNDSKFKKAATEFLLFLTSKERQVANFEKFGLGPSRAAAFNALKASGKFPFMAVLEQSITDGSVRPNIPGGEELLNLMNITVSRILFEGLDPTTGLRQLADEWTKVLAKK